MPALPTEISSLLPHVMKDDTGTTGKSSSAKDTSRSRTPPLGVVSLDAKTGLAAKLFQLPGDDLGKAMQIIDLRCPKALERADASDEAGGKDEDGIRSDEIEINIDRLDNRTFSELNKFVSEAVTRRAAATATAAEDDDDGVYEEEEEEEEEAEFEYEDDEDEEPEVMPGRKKRRFSRQ